MRSEGEVRSEGRRKGEVREGGREGRTQCCDMDISSRQLCKRKRKLCSDYWRDC